MNIRDAWICIWFFHCKLCLILVDGMGFDYEKYKEGDEKQ